MRTMESRLERAIHMVNKAEDQLACAVTDLWRWVNPTPEETLIARRSLDSIGVWPTDLEVLREVIRRR